MRKFALSRFQAPIAVLSVLSLALLAGCEGTTGVPTAAYYSYKEYLTKPHYRAFVTTGESNRGVWSRAWGKSTAERAVEVALRSCREGQSGEVAFLTGTAACSLHSIGDINVWRMTEEQLKEAVDIYKTNPDATNADPSSCDPIIRPGGPCLILQP